MQKHIACDVFFIYWKRMTEAFSIVQALPEGPLDIIGDIHGEYEALLQLMDILGYGSDGTGNPDRSLIFVGDLCDRGPDSPAVIALVKSLISQGRAKATIGNHEINLLTNKAKEGSGWYFSERYNREIPYYGRVQKASSSEKLEIRSFLSTLPIILERKDLRVVHAYWGKSSVQRILNYKDVVSAYAYYEEEWNKLLTTLPWYEQYLKDEEIYRVHGADSDYLMPLLLGRQAFELSRNRFNEVSKLVSGPEYAIQKPYFAGGRWRFTARSRWWQRYEGDKAVIFGHYWRLLGRETALFRAPPLSWLGEKKNCFCNDYSMGARWRDRKEGKKAADSRYHLGALQWPERTLTIETGEKFSTESFKE